MKAFQKSESQRLGNWLDGHRLRGACSSLNNSDLVVKPFDKAEGRVDGLLVASLQFGAKAFDVGVVDDDVEQVALAEVFEHKRERRAGFSDRDIWDIAAVTGFFNMSNRVASATDMRPNSVYHGQAR